ncbi:hypothetical protein FXO37_09073 [Capsicum annuum]|nr:hypothetical protein FXO37_09073 [Capsicum annuum]
MINLMRRLTTNLRSRTYIMKRCSAKDDQYLKCTVFRTDASERYTVLNRCFRRMHCFELMLWNDAILHRNDTLIHEMVNAFRERRTLALSLNGTKTTVNKVHQMLNVLVAIIILVIWLLILRVATMHFLVFLSSQILLMIVEEINILTTVFLRFDNQKIIYPNSVLSTKPISNYYRSPHMGDSVDFCIHISTPMEKISMMKERITRYIENRSDHWYPAPMILMRDVEDLNGIKCAPLNAMDNPAKGFQAKRYEPGDLVEDQMEVFEGDLGVDIFDKEDEDKILDECFVKVAKDGNLLPRQQRKGFKKKKTHERKHSWDGKVSEEVILRQLPMKVAKQKETKFNYINKIQ